MQRSAPFARANLMIAAISAIMASTVGNLAAQQVKIAELGPYVSRGKGSSNGSGRNRIARGAGMVFIRAARKARNVRRHRAACKG